MESALGRLGDVCVPWRGRRRMGRSCTAAFLLSKFVIMQEWGGWIWVFFFCGNVGSISFRVSVR